VKSSPENSCSDLQKVSNSPISAFLGSNTSLKKSVIWVHIQLKLRNREVKPISRVPIKKAYQINGEIKQLVNIKVFGPNLI